jgi:ankyrin repeat protein
VRNDIGSNALHIAVKRRNLEAVKELIALGFPLDDLKSNGVTALGIAVHNSDYTCMKLLIMAKASINKVALKPEPGVSPLNLAVKQQNVQAAEILLKSGAHIYYSSQPELIDHSPLFNAIRQQDTQMLQLFCNYYQ